MQLAGLTAEDLKANLREAQKRLDAALNEYEAAKGEVAWWQQGLRLVDPRAADAIEGGQLAEAIVTELFPYGYVFDAPGIQPTLRQAVVLVMRESPAKPSWTTGELVGALQERNWLPSREDARKRVSDMAGLMHDSGQLSRLGRGIYKLSPPLAAALDADGGRK